MNRRRFIKSMFGIIALIPFVQWNWSKPIFGVDKAEGKDRTEMIIFDNPLSDQEFQRLKSDFLSVTIEGKIRYIPLL